MKNGTPYLLPVLRIPVCARPSCTGDILLCSFTAKFTKTCSKLSTTHCRALMSSLRTRELMSLPTVFTRVITMEWSMLLACSERSVTELMNVPRA